MNKSKFLRVRHALSFIRMNNRCGSHANCIKISAANSVEHELMKFKVCMELAKRNNEFISEAIFGNGARADIICLDRLIIYEILFNESREECKEKAKKYPEDFELRMIDAKQSFNTKLLD